MIFSWRRNSTWAWPLRKDDTHKSRSVHNLAHGPWPVAHGPWPLASGSWPLAPGPWPKGLWPLDLGHRPLVPGPWPLPPPAPGLWPLALGPRGPGHWPLAYGALDQGSCEFISLQIYMVRCILFISNIQGCNAFVLFYYIYIYIFFLYIHASD